MNRCAHFQAQLLEHAYGLLGQSEAETLDAHLDDCADCQHAFERAQAQHEQLGCAARLSFPRLRFEVPVGERLVIEMNKQAAAGNAPAPSSTWFRWAVAAGILLMIASLGIPAGLYSSERDQLALAETRLEELRQQFQQSAAEHAAQRQRLGTQGQSAEEAARAADAAYRNSLDQVDRELADIDRTIKALQRERDLRLGELRKEVGNEQLHMTIRGPIEPEQGAANRYQVETRTLNQPAAGTLFFRVVDEAQRVVYEQKADTNGKFQLALPPGLPVHAPLTLEVSARNKEGQQLVEKLPLSAPGYLTHLSTDRQAYRPGDVVRYRSLTLDRFSLRPAQEDLEVTFTLHGPGGNVLATQTGLAQLVKENDGVVLGPKREPVRGIGAGSYTLPTDAAEGEYSLTVSERHHRFPGSARRFRVEKVEKAPLLASLQFDRAAYGAGQSVTVNVRPQADLKEQLQQAVPAAVVDGQAVPLDRNDQEDGSATFTFTLPKKPSLGEAKLTLTVPAAGKTLTLEKAVPLQLETLHVGFYPEGGDLVAGVPNQVYFQAWTPRGLPASIRGRIVDEQQRVVADVATHDARQGRGRFHFTPAAGVAYKLKIDEPAKLKQVLDPTGNASGANLPAVQPDGVVLHVPAGVSAANAPLKSVVRSAGKDRSVLLTAHCRGQQVAQAQVLARAGQAAEVELVPTTSVGGIYRITAAEEQTAEGKTVVLPRAERLVYRLPGETLGLGIELDKAAYAPGEPVKVRVRSRDQHGKPLPSIALLAVTEPEPDDDRQVSLPGFFLLGADLGRPQDLEYADFLLHGQVDGDALDLLLATQGWRHFVPVDPKQREKILALNRLEVEVSPFIQRKLKLDAELAGQLDPLETKLVQATVARRGLIEQRLGTRQRLQDSRAAIKEQAEAADARLAEITKQLEAERAAARQRYHAALASLARYERLSASIREWWLPLLALVLFVAGAFGLATSAFRRALPGAMPYLATAACTLALFGLLATLPLGLRLGEMAARTEQSWGDRKAGDMVVAQLELPPLLPPLEDPGKQHNADPVAVAAPKPAPELKGDPEGRPVEAEFKKAARALEYQFVARADEKTKKMLEVKDSLGRNGDDKFESAPENGISGAAAVKALRDRPRPPENDAAAAPPPPFVVREYGYRQQRGRPSESQATLCWQPALVLENGEAVLLFDMGSGRRYRILAAAHTADGRLDSIAVPLEGKK